MSGSKRRAPGEGTYEQLPSGLWRVIVREGGKKIAGQAATTKAQARANLADKLKRLRSGSPGTNPSFGVAAAQWLSQMPHLAPTTRDTYAFWTAALEKDPLGKRPVSQIGEFDLRAWVRRCQASGLAPSTVKHRLGFVHQILRANGNMTKIKPPKVEETERRPLSPSERARLDAEIARQPEALRVALMVLRYLGLRVSEACGLMHEDRDGDGVWVRRSVTVTRDAIHIRGKGKTARSHGWVPLPGVMRDLIGPPRAGFVCQGERSGKPSARTPMNPKTLKWHVDKVLKAAGIVIPGSGPHALRRTYGQTLLESGADVVTAAKAMRHDPSILLREYSRTRVDLMTDAVGKAFPGEETA
jgi:integrase